MYDRQGTGLCGTGWIPGAGLGGRHGGVPRGPIGRADDGGQD